MFWLQHWRRRFAHLLHAGRGPAHALQRLRRRRKAAHQLECHERDQGDAGQQYAVHAARRVRHRRRRAARPTSPGPSRAWSGPGRCPRCVRRPGDAGQLGVGRQGASQLLGCGAISHQLWCALDQVDDRRAQLAARLGLQCLAAGGERAGEPRHEHPGEQQRDQQDQARRRAASTTRAPPCPRRRAARSQTGAPRATAGPAASRRPARDATAARRSERRAGRAVPVAPGVRRR